MAVNAIGPAIAAIATSLEALTPVTDSTRRFDVVSYRLASEGGIGSPPKHRTIWLRMGQIEFMKDHASGFLVWNLFMMFSLFHEAKRKRSIEIEQLRAEDITLILEEMIRNTPGRANGVDLWDLEEPPGEPEFDPPFVQTDWVMRAKLKVPALREL